MTLPVPAAVPSGVVPRPNDQLGDILRKIEGRLSENERRTLYSAVVSAGGLTVQDGGAFSVRIPNETTIFYSGPMTFGEDPVIHYHGVIMRRADGSPIFYTFPVGGDPAAIAWRFLDHDGNEVISSDALTGGLARPWIPLQGIPVISTGIPMTVNAGYIATWATGFVPKQQPFVTVTALLRSDSGGVGNARYTVNGVPAGAVMPITAGMFGWQAPQTLALPGAHFDYVSIELEIQRTNASGSVGGTFMGSQRQT